MRDEPQSTEKRALVVSAHPDDAEFTSGGSIARWIDEGWLIHLVVCTDGSKGSDDPGVDTAELVLTRQQEQLAAAKLLGIAEVAFLNYSDGELNRAPDVVAGLSRVIRRFCPHRVLIWDPWRRYQLHPDHRAAGLATLDAILAAGNPHYFLDQIGEGLAVCRVREVYLYGAEEPDLQVDITATFERKMAAIACHHSQVERATNLVENMRRCNAEHGREGRATYAEAFKVLHPFCDI